ncbi:MAG: signal recognition particle protein [Chloroflexota bacterium]
MFELLSERLGQIFKKLSGHGRLGEKDIDEALRQVRIALLEADVNLQVVRNFTARLRQRALGADVLESLSPAQQIIKIVREELISVLGPGAPLTPAPHPPSVLMLVGLQGAGKTTTAAKLALHLRRQGQHALLVAADPYRPAAREQLEVLGRQLNFPVYSSGDVTDLSRGAVARAKEVGASWLIFDTAGRLHVDQELMPELKELRTRLSPSEVLLVVDAMTGQEGVKVAEEFQRAVGLTGLVLTKVDGDARGGVALSVREVVGVPIKFLGTGEKAEALEPFHPDRLASRILGMGDMLTLIEKAEEVWDEKKAREMEHKLKEGRFDLEDFLGQMREMKKMGPLSSLLGMVPGLSGLARQISPADEGRVKRVEAIILSMTPEERRNSQSIDGSRRRRIARGSGTSLQEVNQLLNQLREVQKMVIAMGRGKIRLPGMPRLPMK